MEKTVHYILLKNDNSPDFSYSNTNHGTTYNHTTCHKKTGFLR
jgi:hypothetical protein